MIELSLRCPHCGSIRRWMSYKVNRLEEVDKRRALCFRDGRTFAVRPNIIKVSQYEPKIARQNQQNTVT